VKLDHSRPVPLGEFLFGSVYYPEHWGSAIREKDVALMAEAGWNCVRMAEFAWDRMEPEEGRYEFGFFDEQIARLGAAGIRTILCTPTAGPPVWMTRGHPEILRWNDAGVPMEHGSRQHASHASPVFRDFSRKITTAMASHFASNPHVIGWQTDNEFHCHFSLDHSPPAQKAFVEFLRERYADDIDALNRAWGNSFCALTYRFFDEIRTPKHSRPTYPNPSHVLDYHRFLSHAVTLFQREQAEILRAANSRWFVTHNGFFSHIDYGGEFGKDLDFLSYDSYPFFDPDPTRRIQSHAANLDHARSYGGNFIVTEQQSGPGGQGNYFHDNPEPGEMRRMAYSSIAHGADGLLFFRWRTCRFGAEQYWCGILDHDNVPRRRYREARDLGFELRRVGPAVLGTSVRVDAGIGGGDFEVQTAHETISHGLPGPKQMGELVHGFFNSRGYATGFVHPSHDLSQLSLYVLPHWPMIRAEWVSSLTAFVERGGVLVVGARSGCKDEHNNVISDTPPGLLRVLCGVCVTEFGRQNRPDLRPLPISFGERNVATTLWYEVLETGEAEVIARWSGRHLTGLPAISLARRGRGAVVYVGTYLDQPLLEALLPTILAHSPGLRTLCPPEPGLEVVERSGNGGRVLFLINHQDDPRTVTDVPSGIDLVRGLPVSDRIELPGHGVAVISVPSAG